MHLSTTSGLSTRRGRVAAGRSQRVVPELDGRGELDAHARLCLELALDCAVAGGPGAITVDLRDLTSIDASALTLFARAHADCRAAGSDLRLLISGRARHAAIAYAFASAGLSDQLDFTFEPLAASPVT